MASRAQLISQLQADVPQLNGWPAEAQYAQAVTDAIADLGRRLPRQAWTTIEIVSGTASYALPADFLRAISFSTPVYQEGVIIGDDGLIPVGARPRERWQIAAGQITITPTPAASSSRELRYAALDALGDDDDTYATLDDVRAGLAMLKARAIVLGLQAAKAARDAWVSELGPEKVDKTKQAPELRAAAAMYEAQYNQALASQAGPYGTRS